MQNPDKNDAVKYFEPNPNHSEMVFVPNGFVACDPLPSRSIKLKGASTGFVTVAQKQEMVHTKVIWGNHRIQPGMIVYIEGNDQNMEFAKRIHEAAGRQFVLIPEDRIRLIGRVK